jgi:hypothetical protein
MGDVPVETLFPQGWKCFEWGSSGWPWVLGIDAVGGPPHGDVADERSARVDSRRRPDWLGVTLEGVVVNLVGEVYDQLGSPCQISPPDRMGMEGWWNARQPGQRAWVDRGERCETPVEDGRHIVCGSKVASAGGCQHVVEGVFSCVGRDDEEVGSEGWPCGFGGESGM